MGKESEKSSHWDVLLLKIREFSRRIEYSVASYKTAKFYSCHNIWLPIFLFLRVTSHFILILAVLCFINTYIQSYVHAYIHPYVHTHNFFVWLCLSSTSLLTMNFLKAGTPPIIFICLAQYLENAKYSEIFVELHDIISSKNFISVTINTQI